MAQHSKLNRHDLVMLLVVGLITAAVLDSMVTDSHAQSGSYQAANRIVAENNLPGTSEWQLVKPATHHEIEGYASVTSAQAGDVVELSISTTAPRFSLAVYRMGWYQGLGGRLLLTVNDLPGHAQPIPSPDPTTGMIACRWPTSYSLTTPSTWLSGMYMVKLTASTGYQSYIPLVIRDQRPSAFVFVHASNTDEAYNTWGGKSLYGDSSYSTSEDRVTHRALKVSFDRPFKQEYGAGQFFFWEYHMVRWLERLGYDVTYVTDVDVDQNPSVSLSHRGILFVGHDEYWTKAMRDNVDSAVATGVNLGVFAADTAFWVARYESLDGVPDRVLVCYRYPTTYDPYMTVDKTQVTSHWRGMPVDRPESELLGAMYGGGTYSNIGYDWVAKDPSSWVFKGTELTTGSTLKGLVGYEYDTVVPGYPVPPNLDVLASSPVFNVSHEADTANTTIYIAPSGARVFNAGTIQWSWGLDDFVAPLTTWPATPIANVVIGQITSNILSNFATAPSVPLPTTTSSPVTAADATQTTATRTPTPMPTSTVTPSSLTTQTATPAPMLTTDPTPTAYLRLPAFSVRMVMVAYASTEPSRAMHHSTLRVLRVGQHVKLLVYATYRDVVAPTLVQVGFRIVSNDQTVYFGRQARTITFGSTRRGRAAYWVYFRPKRVGTYTLRGTVLMDGHYRRKSVTFRVVPRWRS